MYYIFKVFLLYCKLEYMKKYNIIAIYDPPNTVGISGLGLN